MTMEPGMRISSESDDEAVRECVVAAYSKYIECIGKKPAPMLEDHEALIEAGDLWVFADGDEVFGSLAMRSKGKHLFVGNLAVNPE